VPERVGGVIEFDRPDLLLEEVPGPDEHEQPLGAGQQHVEPARVVQEAQAVAGVLAVIADQADGNDVGLVALEGVDGVDAAGTAGTAGAGVQGRLEREPLGQPGLPHPPSQQRGLLVVRRQDGELHGVCLLSPQRGQEPFEGRRLGVVCVAGAALDGPGLGGPGVVSAPWDVEPDDRLTADLHRLGEAVQHAGGGAAVLGGPVDELVPVVSARDELTDVGVHAVLLDQNASGGAACGVSGQALPGVAPADGDLAVLERALERLEPVLGVRLESGAFLGGLVPPRRDPLPVEDAGPRVWQPLQGLDDSVEAVEAAQVILVPVGRKLVVVADEQPPVARL